MANLEIQNTNLYLTPRQKECLKLTAGGMTALAISQKLGISVRMVRWHLQQARQRLGAVSSAQAVHIASKGNLLD
jgi:DNA-binding CsgD family transcriptional regulator